MPAEVQANPVLPSRQHCGGFVPRGAAAGAAKRRNGSACSSSRPARGRQLTDSWRVQLQRLRAPASLPPRGATQPWSMRAKASVQPHKSCCVGCLRGRGPYFPGTLFVGRQRSRAARHVCSEAI